MIRNLAVSLLFCAGVLPADTLMLRSGASVDGVFVGGDSHSVRFLVGDHVNVYNLSQIDSINFGPAPQTSDAAPPPAYGSPTPPRPPQGPRDTASSDDANPYGAANNAPPPNTDTNSGTNSGMQVPAGAPVCRTRCKSHPRPHCLRRQA